MVCRTQTQSRTPSTTFYRLEGWVAGNWGWGWRGRWRVVVESGGKEIWRFGSSVTGNAQGSKIVRSQDEARVIREVCMGWMEVMGDEAIRMVGNKGLEHR